MTYPNPAFAIDDATARRILLARGFVDIVAADHLGRLAVKPTPLVAAPNSAHQIEIRLAASHPLNDTLAGTGQALISVHGRDVYVQPHWYGMWDHQVPTWIYIHVPANVAVEPLSAPALHPYVTALNKRVEAGRDQPWHPDHMTGDRFISMYRHILGNRLSATQWRGQRKLAQHKPAGATAQLTPHLRHHADCHADWTAAPIIDARAALPARQCGQPGAGS